jgi:hypothetical protein
MCPRARRAASSVATTFGRNWRVGVRPNVGLNVLITLNLFNYVIFLTFLVFPNVGVNANKMEFFEIINF